MTTRTVLDDAVDAARVFFQNPNITKRSIWKRSKSPKYTEPRHFVCAFIRARDPQRFSYPVIARLTRRKDHTSCLNSVQRAHKEWGAQLFQKLALTVVEQAPQEGSAQVVHSVSAEALLAIGEANLARFFNGKGWAA